MLLDDWEDSLLARLHSWLRLKSAGQFTQSHLLERGDRVTVQCRGLRGEGAGEARPSPKGAPPAATGQRVAYVDPTSVVCLLFAESPSALTLVALAIIRPDYAPCSSAGSSWYSGA